MLQHMLALPDSLAAPPHAKAYQRELGAALDEARVKVIRLHVVGAVDCNLHAAACVVV